MSLSVAVSLEKAERSLTFLARSAADTTRPERRSCVSVWSSFSVLRESREGCDFPRQICCRHYQTRETGLCFCVVVIQFLVLSSSVSVLTAINITRFGTVGKTGLCRGVVVIRCPERKERGVLVFLAVFSCVSLPCMDITRPETREEEEEKTCVSATSSVSVCREKREQSDYIFFFFFRHISLCVV